MESKQISTTDWDEFVAKQTFTIFVQSSQYVDFYQKLGEVGCVFGIFDQGQLIGGSVVVSTHAKRGNFMFLPYGPILPDDHRATAALESLTYALIQYGNEHHYDFIRVSPFIDDTEQHRLMFHQLGYKSAPIHVLAEHTWLLDVRLDEEALLKAMNKNHRNLIRRCEKSGVTIVKSTTDEDLELVYTLLKETATRHQFFKFPFSYIKAEFSTFLANNQAIIFKAILPNGQVDAASVMMYFGTMGVYRHSGSLQLDNHLPTSYLIQWEAIKEAKKRGMHYYNFWGIAPDHAPASHPFTGIRHFKKGFGGFQKDLLHCQDYPLRPKYLYTWLIETIRRIKRGF